MSGGGPKTEDLQLVRTLKLDSALFAGLAV